MRGQSSVTGGSSHIIVDDASQGYGVDSEIDDQDMINEIGKSHVFIEGESDIIDEDDEANHSIDELRRRSTVPKKNKSLDDFDGEQIEEPVNQQDFLRGLKQEIEE